MEFISMAEKKPPVRGEYLAWQPESEMMGERVAARYAVLMWNGRKFYSSLPVTHWAKLPPRPDPQERSQ